jgi:hypothetical protein
VFDNDTQLLQVYAVVFETSWTCHILFALGNRGLFLARFPARSAGRTDVPSFGMDEDFGGWFLFAPGNHARSSADAVLHSRTIATGIAEPAFDCDPGQSIFQFCVYAFAFAKPLCCSI